MARKGVRRQGGERHRRHGTPLRWVSSTPSGAARRQPSQTDSRVDGQSHGVIFTDDLSDAMVLGHGPELERHPMWPDRANIEFARTDAPDRITMRVWERGSGETMACGTGACRHTGGGGNQRTGPVARPR